MPVVLEFFLSQQGQSILEIAYDVVNSDNSSILPEEAKYFEVSASAVSLTDRHSKFLWQ